MTSSNLKIPVFQGATVSCAGNPMDIRPVLAAIMTAENWILERLPKNVPLIILMGECHNMPTNKALQQGLLIEQVEQQYKFPSRRFAFGIEAFTAYSDSNNKENLLHRIQDTKELSDYATDSNLTLLKLCHQFNIPTIFNDVRKKNAYEKTGDDEKQIYFDTSHPPTRKVIEDFFPNKSDTPVRTTSANGVMLRNQFMVQQALRHIKKNKTKIFIQSTGRAHLFGSNEYLEPFEYSDSLSALFQQAGCAVLTIFPTFSSSNTDAIPHEAKEQIKQSIIVEGLSEETYEFCRALNHEEAQEFKMSLEECVKQLEKNMAAFVKGEYIFPPRNKCQPSFSPEVPEKTFWNEIDRQSGGALTPKSFPI